MARPRDPVPPWPPWAVWTSRSQHHASMRAFHIRVVLAQRWSSFASHGSSELTASLWLSPLPLATQTILIEIYKILITYTLLVPWGGGCIYYFWSEITQQDSILAHLCQGVWQISNNYLTNKSSMDMTGTVGEHNQSWLDGRLQTRESESGQWANERTHERHHLALVTTWQCDLRMKRYSLNELQN